MRQLHNAERIKRGCKYCAEVFPPDMGDSDYRRQLLCPHEKCPYQDLDDTTYAEYFKQTDVSSIEKILGDLGKN